MPYTVVKRGGKWCVVKSADTSGKPLGCHDSKAEATKQLVAVRINTKE